MNKLVIWIISVGIFLSGCATKYFVRGDRVSEDTYNIYLKKCNNNYQNMQKNDMFLQGEPKEIYINNCMKNEYGAEKNKQTYNTYNDDFDDSGLQHYLDQEKKIKETFENKKDSNNDYNLLKIENNLLKTSIK